MIKYEYKLYYTTSISVIKVKTVILILWILILKDIETLRQQ